MRKLRKRGIKDEKKKFPNNTLNHKKKTFYGIENLTFRSKFFIAFEKFISYIIDSWFIRFNV